MILSSLRCRSRDRSVHGVITTGFGQLIVRCSFSSLWSTSTRASRALAALADYRVAEIESTASRPQ